GVTMLHIGISGPIASGKTTLAYALQNKARDAGFYCEVQAFASGIRELLTLEREDARIAKLTARIYGWGWNLESAKLAAFFIDQYMQEFPTQPEIKNRRLMQLVGTEVGRNIVDRNFWIYRTQQLLRNMG